VKGSFQLRGLTILSTAPGNPAFLCISYTNSSVIGESLFSVLPINKKEEEFGVVPQERQVPQPVKFTLHHNFQKKITTIVNILNQAWFDFFCFFQIFRNC